MYAKLLFITILITPIYSSGGYDIGTSNGKGVLKLDLTWNPFDLIDFGRFSIDFAVLSNGFQFAQRGFVVTTLCNAGVSEGSPLKHHD